jgi:flagellar hook assembly protein FlgD
VDLGPNRPNPFSGSTEIAFHLARPGRARLRIYDVAGQVVATLIDGEMAAGPHAVTWDGRDRSGRAVASGLYFYGLSSQDGRGTRRMMLLR